MVCDTLMRRSAINRERGHDALDAKSTVSQPAEFGEKCVGATARIRGPILGLRKVRGIVETEPDFGEAMRGAGVEDHLALSLEGSSAPAEVILRCR